MGLPLTGHAAGSQGAKSRVVLIRDKKLTDSSGALRADRLSDMLDKAMMALIETSNYNSAWQRLFKPDDVVGTLGWLLSPEAGFVSGQVISLTGAQL